MFIGHFSVGLAAKRATPDIPLAVLFGAAQFADMLWPFLVALGIEQVQIDPGNTAFTPLAFVSYPYSHSLVFLVLWGIIYGVAYTRGSVQRPAFLVLAALVVSHWILDWITHRPDMPLYPGGPTFGLGLWNSISWTIAIEVAMFGAGVWIYAATTRARNRAGQIGFWILIVLLLVTYLGSVSSPPPSVRAIYLSAIAGAAVILVWSWWADRNRVAVTSTA